MFEVVMVIGCESEKPHLMSQSTESLPARGSAYFIIGAVADGVQLRSFVAINLETKLLPPQSASDFGRQM